MTKNELLSRFYVSAELDACINKVQPAGLRSDIRNEVMLALCEEEDNTIQQLHKRSQLAKKAACLIVNMAKNSPLYAGQGIKFANLSTCYNIAAEDNTPYPHETAPLNKAKPARATCRYRCTTTTKKEPA